MNKRQVLDIVLIIFGIYFLMSFLTLLVSLPFFILMQENQFMKKGPYIFMTGLHLLIFLVLSAIFLFKREKLLNIFVGKSEQQEAIQTDSTPCYARLAFWIQIIGLYYLISSGTKAIGQLTGVISFNRQYVSDNFWWYQTGPYIVATIVAALLIWKNEAIANFIKKITNSPKIL